MNRRQIGAHYESVAADYLAARGYRILERNYRNRTGEIDIIARMDERIVFVEVKARFGSRYGTPGEAITQAKAAKIRRAALVYLKQNGGTAQRTRFDAVLISEEGIKHIPGAF